jgi:predicted HAD superfamily Cof-like phosphohydrolase
MAWGRGVPPVLSVSNTNGVETVKESATEPATVEPSISQCQIRTEEFMRAGGQTVEDSPTTPCERDRELRADLIFEEAMETIKALGIHVYDFTGTEITSKSRREGDLRFEVGPDEEFDLVEAIDGCCDLIVVATGTLSTIGVPDRPFQLEVDTANLRKIGADGKCQRRDDGKIIKPDGWTAPDHVAVLEKLFGENSRAAGEGL